MDACNVDIILPKKNMNVKLVFISTTLEYTFIIMFILKIHINAYQIPIQKQLDCVVVLLRNIMKIKEYMNA